MKRCPECRKDCSDDSLLYCLDDGAALVQGTVADEPATAILSGGVISGENVTRTLKSADTAGQKSRIAEQISGLFSRDRLPWLAALLFGLTAATVLGYTYFDRSPVNEKAVRLSFDPPADLSFNDVQPDWAVISPDGQKIAFSAIGADGKNMLYIRELASNEAKLLPGSDNPVEPFWSPDSKAVAYGSNGKLKRSDLNGGNGQVLCDAVRIVGGSWSKDGTIVFVPDYRSPLVQVSAKGGEPKPVLMNLDPADGPNREHRYPYFLPDGRHFLFRRERKGIWAGSLDSPEIVPIMADGAVAVYTQGGWLLFIRNDALLAQAFDAEKLQLRGEAVPVIADQKSWANNPAFSVSDNGVLLWQGTWSRDYQLVWYDREGKPVGNVEAPAKITVGEDPRISPDGKRVAIKHNPPQTLWVVDLEKGTSVRITSDFGQFPVWSPDGSRLAYSATPGLVTKASNGLGDADIILSSESAGATFPFDWSPDGRYIIYNKRGVKSRSDLYALAVGDEKKEILLLSSPFDEISPAISFDGKWLAYAADDTGGYEIYVQSFAPDGRSASDRKLISTTGGRLPVWRRDGTELFFVAADGQLMSASVKTGGCEFEFTTPKALFKTRMLTNSGSGHEFDVSPDGQRFLIGTLIGDTKALAPTVLLNWTAALRK